ncbi:MAG: hypothetical protein AAF587_29800 [Bacteroidota bacterium]
MLYFLNISSPPLFAMKKTASPNRHFSTFIPLFRRIVYLSGIICWITNGSPVFSQVHLINQGGKIVIQEDTQLRVAGDWVNLSVNGEEGQLIAGGELVLGGNWLNHASSTSIFFPIGPKGRIRFQGNQHPQLLGGTTASRLGWLVIDNPHGLELQQELRVTDRLSFWQGKLDASLFLLTISNTATGIIDSVSEDRYIIGQLRRYLTSGIYPLPIGTPAYLEAASLDIHHSQGLPYIDIHFSEEQLPSPIDLYQDGARITELLDYGFWQIEAPYGYQASFDLRVQSRGHQNGGADPRQHALFHRTAQSWESSGQHDNSQQSGSGLQPITSSRQELNTFGEFAIGLSEYVLSNGTERDPIFSHFSVGGNGGSSRRLHIRFSAQEVRTYSLKLMDYQGKLLSQQLGLSKVGINEVMIDLGPYAQGVYLLQLEREGEIHQRKVW